MLPIELHLFAEAGSSLAPEAASFVDSAMEFALPSLKGLAVLIIVWGVVCAAIRLVGMEIKVLQGKEYKRDAAAIRAHLGYYLLLALEFLIAVDVIETLLNPEWKELGILAALVVLRTMMSFSLHFELKEIEAEQPVEQPNAAAANTAVD
jgi:uncharacterized membrane protein